MKQLMRYLRRLWYKFHSIYNASNEVLYRIQVTDCYYSEEQQEYIAVLKRTNRPKAIVKMSVREIVADAKILSQIHPVQASSLGWMAREAHYKFAANDSRYRHTQHH